MECLNNLVGLRGCDIDSVPQIYIDDIIPINLTDLDEISDGFQNNGQGLFNEKMSAAQGLIINDISGLINVEFINVVESHVIGEFDEGFEDVADLERGVQLKRKERCFLSGFEITDIDFCSSEDSPNPTIKVYVDGILEKLFFLDDFERFKVFGKVINIVTDNSAINVCKSGNQDLLDNCTCKCNVAHKSFYARGWDGENISASTFGLKLSVNVICDISQIICNYSSYLAYVLAYKIYVLILEQATISDKCSIFLSGSKEAIREQLLLYDRGYSINESDHVGKYWDEAKKAAKNIEKMIIQSGCSCCYKCRKPYYAKSYN